MWKLNCNNVNVGFLNFGKVNQLRKGNKK